MNTAADTSSHNLLFLILVVAFALRLTAFPIFHAGGYTSDEREYIFLASKVAAGQEFVDSNGEQSTRSPLYPMALGLLFSAFGTDLRIPHIIGCALGTLVVFLGYRLGKALTSDEGIGLATAALMSVYPGLIVYSGILQTETLYMVFLLFTLMLSIELAKKPTWQKSTLFGAVAGVAALTRAVFFGFLPIVTIALGVMYNKANGRNTLRLLLIAVTVFCAVLAPWTMRNYAVHGELIPVSSWGGISFLTGNNPYATGTWSTKEGFDDWVEQQAKGHGHGSFQSLTEIQRSSVAREIAGDYMIAHPFQAMVLAIKKAHIMIVYPITNSDTDTRMQALAVVADVFLYALCIVGIVSCWPLKREFVLPVLAVLFFIVTQIALHAEARYRLPLVPVFCVMAAVGWHSLSRAGERIALLGSKKRVGLIVCGLTALGVVYMYTGWLFLQGSV